VRFASRQRSPAEINLMPLIDILFLVLVFLVVTATFTERTVLPISLPQAATATPDAGEESGLVVSIDAGGTLYVDGMEQDVAAVARRLQAIREPASTTITIAADSRVAHGRVIQVVDLVRESGIVRLDIQTLTTDSLLPR
jgi:biopolymer transport protein ExbD